MAQHIVLNTSIGNPTTPAVPDMTVEQIVPATPASQTCTSKNCVHKSKAKTEDEEDKKQKKKKRKSKRKEESESESSDSDEASASSDSSDSESESESSESDSSSDSESESRKKKKKKSKAKSKKDSKKVKKSKDREKEKEKSKSSKKKGKKSKEVKYNVEDESNTSKEETADTTSSDDVSNLKKDIESSSLFKNSKENRSLLRKLLKLATRKGTDDDAASTKSGQSDQSSASEKPKQEEKEKKSTKEANPEKPKYKRLDEIWDEDLYDYRLRETSDKKETDEWEKYIFTIRRKFDVENHYQSTVVDIKSEPLKECLKIVMEDVQGVSLVEKTPRLMPDMLFLHLEDFREYCKVLNDERKKSEKKKIKKALKIKVKHLELLIAYLDKDYDEMKKTLYPMLENGTITFDLLWALYKPNSIAYAPTFGDETQPRAFRVDYVCKERDYARGLYYGIEGKYFDFDGENFGRAFIDATVFQFQGARKITSLPCYPLKYHQNEQALRVKLIERGKKFISLAGMNYKLCKGICYVKKENSVLKVNISGRAMVDSKTFRRVNPNYPLCEVEARNVEDEVIECRCDKQDQPRKPKPGDDRFFIMEKQDDKVINVIEVTSTDSRLPANLTDSVKRTEAAKQTFTEEEILIATPLLPGFCFNEKLWVEIPVSTISDVQWNTGAFDSLVIPEKHKEIVKALVSAHGQHASRSIDDVVSGKGKGLVAVLHGKPGLGKTLTCEAVSDLLKRPLYTVSAGDLGTSASHLEVQLQTILDVAHTWGAVLLLDEADVFLEERSSRDVSRNALVSVFLRLLEYFQGILMMTTNRVETFDEAFVSRIHLSLRYGELTAPARKAIWKTFINKVAESASNAAAAVTAAPASTNVTSNASSTCAPTPDTTASTPNSGAATPVTPSSSASVASNETDKTVTLASSKESSSEKSAEAKVDKEPALLGIENISEANYLELSRVDLNGRQIKNLVKTAQALALYEGVPMGMGHLRRCIEVGRSFEMDLKGGRGWEDVMRSYT